MTIPHETPEEEALRNSIILHQIMAYSSPDHLKRNRLVNKDWSAVATSTALSRDCFLVRLKCFNNFDSFSHNVRGGGGGGGVGGGGGRRPTSGSSFNLENLNKILENSSNFPATHFQFDEGNLASIDVQDFFDICGFYIKTLSLRSTPGLGACVTPRETFLKILTQQAPHLESLTVEGFDFTWTENDQQKISLPNLKRLTLPPHLDDGTREMGTEPENVTMSTIELLLCGATQLKSIHSYLPPLHTKVLEKTGQLHLVKSLAEFNVNWPSPWTIEDMRKFVKSKPHLTQFHIAMPERGSSVPSQELVESFLKILTSSKDTLKKLELGELQYSNNVKGRNGQFPSFSNLETLVLKEPAGSGGQFFPPSTHLHKTFPKLKTLALAPSYSWDKHVLFANNDDKINDDDETTMGFVTVQNLEIHDNFGEDCLEKLRKELCPNFTHLKVHGFCRLDLFLPTIFRVWPHLLQGLTVMVDNLQNLDEALTGFCKKDCQQLLLPTTDDVARDDPQLPEMRGPWIGDCRDLKNLEINFCSRSSYFTASHSRPFTRLSGLYAFQKLMEKNVQVTIGYDKFGRWSHRLERTLVSVLPFATIVQYHVDR